MLCETWSVSDCWGRSQTISREDIFWDVLLFYSFIVFLVDNVKCLVDDITV